MGALSALTGSALIAFLVAVMGKTFGVNVRDPRVDPWLQFGVITFAGFAGSLVDFLLGATKQAIYFCPACQKES